ncbi:MAG TPA: Rieske 2Fe-2S domain-containing protein [Chloroflexota bacterium]|nr:Rieske 2Fe-2S domain-containing protein [Chloroflexota bacterium]
MLSREDNELLTRVGPGTAMGEVLRRYWMPALLVQDLPGPDCPPVRVKLLGEELVAFRDTNGRIGLLDEYCPHRMTSLFLGRNEKCGLRCVYHGWKFDVDGNCLDMPNEPADSRFKDKIHLLSYPAEEYGGIIWAYLGPADKKPDLPGHEWLRAPESHRFVSKTLEFANYAQGVEGGIDTAHSSFLHNNDLSRKGLRQLDTAPDLQVEPTPYGFRYAGVRNVGERGNYVRVYQFVMPFHQFRSSRVEGTLDSQHSYQVPTIRGHMWVPRDDESTMIFNWVYACNEDKPLAREFIEDEEERAGRGPAGESEIRHRTRENNWLIDREMQRTKNYTGVYGVNTQDLAVQEAMGRIVPRWREHLTSTDKAIITFRRMMLQAAKDLENGIEPPGADPDTYWDVRPMDAVLPQGVDWHDATRDELRARR